MYINSRDEAVWKGLRDGAIIFFTVIMPLFMLAAFLHAPESVC